VLHRDGRSLNPHTVDFTGASSGTATVSVTATGIGGIPAGSYAATLNAYTVSNTSGLPDATLNIPVTVN
jgi:hypothetical protein